MKRRGSRSDREIEAWVEKRIKEGYGQGKFESYRPWLDHFDFTSMGRNGTCRGNKINRSFKLFSDLERNYFYILDYSDGVIDINEQFPLLDRVTVCEAATDLGVKPSLYIGTNVPYVMTTDFYLKVRDGDETKQVVRTVKYSKDLKKKRVLEKLAVEQEYFRRKGITDWKIITEEEVNPKVVANISFFRNNFYLESISDFMKIELGEAERIVETFKDAITETPVKVSEICSDLDRSFGNGSGIKVYKHLLSRKEIEFDLTVPLGSNDLIVKSEGKISLVSRKHLPKR